MSACDYIREWRARQPFSGMVAPERHHNLLVRALWFKQRAWEADAELDGAPYPSAEYDEAFDESLAADEKYEAAIIEAWALRALERGYVPMTHANTNTLLPEQSFSNKEAGI